jgi:hypothetical protein
MHLIPAVVGNTLGGLLAGMNKQRLPEATVSIPAEVKKEVGNTSHQAGDNQENRPGGWYFLPPSLPPLGWTQWLLGVAVYSSWWDWHRRINMPASNPPRVFPTTAGMRCMPAAVVDARCVTTGQFKVLLVIAGLVAGISYLLLYLRWDGHSGFWAEVKKEVGNTSHQAGDNQENFELSCAPDKYAR